MSSTAITDFIVWWFFGWVMVGYIIGQIYKKVKGEDV